MEQRTSAFTETILGGDPGDRPWEGCINSVTYRVPRGIPVLLPDFLIRHIERTDAERRAAEENAERLSASALKENNGKTGGYDHDA